MITLSIRDQPKGETDMPATRRPMNYTTKVPASQTVTECQSALAAAGADTVSVHFDDGQPSGLSFTLRTPHGTRNFILPVNIDGVHAMLTALDNAGKLPPPGGGPGRGRGLYQSRDHAARVAWRVLKDWIEANLARIAARMATLDEVMLPYLVVDDGERTLWQAYQDRSPALELTTGEAPSRA
jgi:hypothetical protein